MARKVRKSKKSISTEDLQAAIHPAGRTPSVPKDQLEAHLVSYAERFTVAQDKVTFHFWRNHGKGYVVCEQVNSLTHKFSTWVFQPERAGRPKYKATNAMGFASAELAKAEAIARRIKDNKGNQSFADFKYIVLTNGSFEYFTSKKKAQAKHGDLSQD